MSCACIDLSLLPTVVQGQAPHSPVTMVATLFLLQQTASSTEGAINVWFGQVFCPYNDKCVANTSPQY